jgi:hypothetical protein
VQVGIERKTEGESISMEATCFEEISMEETCDEKINVQVKTKIEESGTTTEFSTTESSNTSSSGLR